MKKKIQLVCMLLLLIFAGIWIYDDGKKEVIFRLDEKGAPVLTIKCDTGAMELCSWEDEVSGNTYFFLPSFIEDNTIYFGNIFGKKLIVDGKKISSDSEMECEEEKLYRFEIADNTYNIIFLKSANVPTLFIDTASGGMEYLNSNKENEETGHISVITESGMVEYQGKLAKITGRGNSSWDLWKKPYSFQLSSARSLCGLDEGKKWSLISLCREGSRMNNKVAFDMAEAIGLEYSSQSVWVDLYLNGEYAGIYLLAEPVSVGDGRVEVYDLEKENTALNKNWLSASTFAEEDEKGYLIDSGTNLTGGYLIEKDYHWYYAEERAGFMTDSNACFTIKSPQNVSKEQVAYIHNYIQQIEDMIVAGNPDYENYIDVDSFTKRFIVDEIAWNYDTGVTSMFFYKERDNNRLYSGPVWDYDLAFGEASTTWVEGKMVDYEETIVDNIRDGYEKLNWYSYLYEDEQFYQAMADNYKEFLPYMEELIEVKIDEYADRIRPSVKMDSIRWKNENQAGDKAGIYMDFENNVRYFKYFLANRLNYLNERWGVEYKQFETPSNGEMHEVKFEVDGKVIESIQVSDGKVIEVFPEMNSEKEVQWYFSYSDEPYMSKLPIYEDVTLYAK